MSQPTPPPNDALSFQPRRGQLVRWWSTLPRADRALLTAVVAAAAGSLAVLASNGRNANGVPGASPIILILALISAGGWWRLRRRGPLSSMDLPLLMAAPLALTALVLLELLETIRIGFATQQLGVGGLVGRVAAAAGGSLLIVGLLAGRRIPLRWPVGVAWLTIGGALLIVAGWVLLIGVAADFAMRVLDAVGIAAAVGAASLASAGLADRRARLMLTALAAIVVAVGFDVVVTLAPHLSTLVAGGSGSLLLVMAYLVGVVAIGASAILAGRTAHSRTDPAP